MSPRPDNLELPHDAHVTPDGDDDSDFEKQRVAIEWARLKSERRKSALEFRLRRRELGDRPNRGWELLANPFTLAIVGGFITLMTTIVSNHLTSSANIASEEVRAGLAAKAEVEKAELAARGAKQTLQADLIKKFVESPKTAVVRENLRFLIDAGLLPDYAQDIKRYLDDHPDAEPQVGTMGDHEGKLIPGVWRWQIKTTLAGGADPTSARQVALSDLMKLKPPTPFPTTNDSYQNTRIDYIDETLNIREGDLVRTEGWLHLVAEELSGDYTLQLSPTKEDQSACFRLKIPRPEPEFVASSELRPLFALARKHVMDILGDEKDILGDEKPNVRNSITPPEPVRVQAAGQLFINFSRGHSSIIGRDGCNSPTIWEMHPVIFFEGAH